MVGAARFVETFVDTPAGVCEQRDVKGFYAQARAGGIQGFTWVDDPYEPPEASEVRLETTDCSPEQNARKVLAWLVEQGFLPADNRRA